MIVPIRIIFIPQWVVFLAVAILFVMNIILIGTIMAHYNTLMQVTKELTEVETSVAEIKFIQNGPNDCPKGWTPWRRSCYWVSNTQLNFNEAVKDCDTKNALVA